MVARGEFSIAIAGIGTAGGIEPELAALARAYVLLMAVVGPLAAKVVDPVVQRMQARTGTRASPAT